MDTFRQKKQENVKQHEKCKHSFAADVKAIKENLKIKEILRTVKINSSMRIKAPRGSKVMSNDLSDAQDGEHHPDVDVVSNDMNCSGITQEVTMTSDEDIKCVECFNDSLPDESAVNPCDTKVSDDFVLDNDVEESIRTFDEVISCVVKEISGIESASKDNEIRIIDKNPVENSDEVNSKSSDVTCNDTLAVLPNIGNGRMSRTRKLSLDHTILGRESFCQSEADLHSVGKSPLERKSSFFRKKMDSFLKNTSEVFRRQSIKRRGSMSCSMQSLNENSIYTGRYESPTGSQDIHGSITSLASTMADSTSSLSRVDSQSQLSAGTSSTAAVAESVHSLNESLLAENLINSRAISMSSGLDSTQGPGRRRANRANRVTWLASEGLTNYLRRMIQDEKTREQGDHKENQAKDSKGRRLSYQRAVSGEDPVRFQGSLRRRSQINDQVMPFKIIATVENNKLHFLTIPAGWETSGILYCPPIDKNNLILVENSSPEDDWRAISCVVKKDNCTYEEARNELMEMFIRNVQEMNKSAQKTQLHIHPAASAITASSIANDFVLGSVELTSILNEFNRSGVPALRGFSMYHICEDALATLHWADFTQELAVRIDFTKMPPYEESRQAVILELVTTEVNYIQHLMAIVEIFMAAAHAIQDQGKLLQVDTERLFSNIPDVLNANLQFYEITFYPMVHDAIVTKSLFNSDLMYPGFYHFRDIFTPYDKLLSDQGNMISYLRTLSSDTDFLLYLSWCYAQKPINRLQLSDLLVKPMQRLTKYGMLLQRLASHTDAEPDRTNVTAMENFAKNYVIDLNRSIRQREETELIIHLSEIIEPYEVDFKDEDMDFLYGAYSSDLNLNGPMVGCMPYHGRSLIFQGDLKFRDIRKDTKVRTCGMEVRAFLLTDMLLLCKKIPVKGGGPCTYKLIRPKYMMDRIIHFYKYSKTRPNKDPLALLFVMLDDVGTAYDGFALGDPTKEDNPAYTKYLQTWESKIREAKLTYDLGVAYARNPSQDLSEMDMDTVSEGGKTTEIINKYTKSVTLPEHIVLCIHPSSANNRKPTAEDLIIERDARERVAAMLHRSMGVSTDLEFSQTSMNTDSFDATTTSGQRSLRYPMFRTSTGGSSHQSRLSSFQHSLSGASHDEPLSTRNMYRAGSSVEHHIPPEYADDGVTSITVNVVSESESETMVPKQIGPSPAPRPVSRSASTSKQHRLCVQPQRGPMTLVHSLPDLTLDPSPRFYSMQARSPSPQSASEKLYQSHHELLSRNRLSSSSHGHYLHPDHRGKSYPPPRSNSRGSLKRGLAFSCSFNTYPPLSKMGHVESQSQPPAESTTSKESLKSEKSKEDDEKDPKEKSKKKDKGKAKLSQKAKQSKEKDKKEKDKAKESEQDVKAKDGNEPINAGEDRTSVNIDPGAGRDGLAREKPPGRERFMDWLRHRGKSEEAEPGTVNPLLLAGSSKDGKDDDDPLTPPAAALKSLKGMMSSAFFTSGGWHNKLDG